MAERQAAQDDARGRDLKSEVASLKRLRILDAAATLFYERGYANTTLDDVAAQLGVTKPFIYSHVGSKSVLLGQISSIGIERAIAALETALARDLAPAETLRLFLPLYVEAVLDSQKSIAINIREEKNLDPVDAARLDGLRGRFMQGLEGLLKRGVEAGEFATPDTRVAAFALVGAVSWTTFWFNPAGALSIREISDRMTRMVMTIVDVRPDGRV